MHDNIIQLVGSCNIKSQSKIKIQISPKFESFKMNKTQRLIRSKINLKIIVQ